MADFESIIKNHASEDGSISSDAIGKLAKAISTAVGNEFVDKVRYKAKLEEIDDLTGKLQTAEDSVTTAEKWKTKYTALKEDFAKYKSDQTAKETHAAKETAYRALLRDVGISAKRIERVLQLCDVDGVELDEKGAIKDADTLKESIKTEWADFVEYTTTTGAQISRPPVNTGGASKLTVEEIDNIKDPGERVRAIAQNLDLYGAK